jgi:hypothetical protein
MKKPNKKSKKSEETLGILAHLQKNIPEAPKEEDEMEFPEDEDEDEMPSLLAPKPPKKLLQ